MPGSHMGAVMALGWNQQHRQVLASGSADHTVKLWDVTTQECQRTLKHHSDKVQDVQWHPTEATVLATASYDGTVACVDARDPDARTASFRLPADAECARWNPSSPAQLVATAEDGSLTCFDIRKPGAAGGGGGGKASASVWSIDAHPMAATCLSFSPQVDGLMATASIDKTVKLWDLGANGGTGGVPQLVAAKEMAVGKLFSMGFSETEPYLLSAGGGKGVIALWETNEDPNVLRRFASRGLPAGAPAAAKAKAAADAPPPPPPKAKASAKPAGADEVAEAAAPAPAAGGNPVSRDKKKKKKKKVVSKK